MNVAAKDLWRESKRDGERWHFFSTNQLQLSVTRFIHGPVQGAVGLLSWSKSSVAPFLPFDP